MAILHLLNIADLFFMAVGVAVALVMIAMGGNEERRKVDRIDGAGATDKTATRVRRR